MKKKICKPAETESYKGFEQGPIRPPSEANSLLIRLTRNCPWNQCTFCPVYKDTKFSFRPFDHIIKDIDTVSRYVTILRDIMDDSGHISQDEIHKIAGNVPQGEMPALNAAFHWLSGQMHSVFLQDANSLILKPSELIKILSHLLKCFSWI